MSRLERLWVAMLTHDSSYAGTNSRTVIIITEDGIDRLHHTFTDTSQPDQEKGLANLYRVDVEENYIIPGNLGNSSVRVGTRGGDLWKPEHYVVWGERVLGMQDVGSFVPIAIETDLSARLSTEDGEGNISFPLRRVGLGAKDMPINRLLMVILTADVNNAGTDDEIRLQITVPAASPIPGDVVRKVNFVANTPQDDQERAQANFYLVPVNSSFTYNDLPAADSISLSTDGSDAWLPKSFFLFGLDNASGRPNFLVPLVCRNNWSSDKWLSTDSNEGDSSVLLYKYVY